MTDDFVHLHVHSEYSLLDGLGRIKNLVKEAKRLGQPALALTDHGVMHGAIEFFRACKEFGIRPLIGVEGYQTVFGRPMGGRDAQFDKENYHLLMLAKNMTGYHNLLQIATHAQLNGYYYKPRVDHEFLAAHADGLIGTTGCLGAEVPQLLAQGKDKEAYDRLGWYVDVFGRENFFIEIQEHSIGELVQVNKTLVPWAEKFGLQLVATNDVHYVREEDGGPHDVLLCVQTGVMISAQNRMRMSDGSYFLKSREQMEATFRPFIDLPSSAFDHTLRVAEMCEVDLEDPNYHLPDLPIPEGHNYGSYLRELTEDGLRRLYGERAGDPIVIERKERELKIIHSMGFDVYFLIVADLCNFARRRNIWWNVRGSGAGSLVAYCTGITGIDPLKNNLIFERFLNPGRVTMPDFDLDFPDDQREEMIRYTVEKFGESQVAQIATFNRMKAKAAVRDVGRAQGVELAQVDKIAKLIPGIPGKPVTIQDCLTEGHEFYSQELTELYAKEQWVKELLDTAMKLEGVARNAGIHAAAVIVADRELQHYTPLMRGSKSTVTSTIAQYEFPILESIGLLKVDFLGLSTLSVMREATRLIKERHGIEYTLGNIPYEGAEAVEAFKLITSGEVSGVFQVESAGMRRMLTEMKPTLFEHIVAAISLYRPGPMEYIPQYIRRMHGEETVEFKHPLLEPILGETYAILVYQEQIIQALSSLAGYTPGEADLVRRAISKKKASDIEKHKKLFVAGCGKNGIDEGTAGDIYADIEFFARYGFNKCLPGDTEVVDAQTGRLVRIEDLFTGRARLGQTITCDIDALKLKAGRVAQVFENGVKPVFRLTTALGRTIEATANHPFYGADGWRLLEQLHTGDQIAVPRRLQLPGVTEWPEPEVVALAHSLADGKRTPEIEIPAAAFSLTPRQLSLLIGRVWESDGHINVKGHSLFYATASERLARQMQHLLLRFGIISRLRTVNFLYKAGRTGYRLFVTGNENLGAFRQSIGAHFVSPSRKEKLDLLCLASGETIGTKNMVPVAINDAVRGAPRESHPAGAASRRSSAHTTSQHLADGYGDGDSRAHTPSDVYWDRIVSIAYAGDKPTYDLEIPGTHNFVANDILVHNSHAADYAVITVQTAYLKAHYPVEYMAAQLLVERDKTEKVVNFVSECRRMGVDVLPPDVNYSGLDFDIQLRPPDTPTMAHRDPSLGYPFPVPAGSCIRFGMAAIKNVGEGPVRVIIDARKEGGAFTGLEEFCDRVDLRQVNKRALECLIKAGAMDRFGRRSQLLAVLEQLVAQSASIHDARDSGQLSMFDLMGSAGEVHVSPIKLPDLEEIKGKEKLQWEKELLGVYSISHPLLQIDVDLKKVTSCSCAELDERYDGKGVTLAGIIAGVRTINTKKGDAMAFVQLEDLQGSCEAVFFPKTFAEYKDKLVTDAVVIIKGKAQTREGQTSLLAELVQTHFDKVVSIGDEPERLQTPLFGGGPTMNGLLLEHESATWDDGMPAEEFAGSFAAGDENPFRNEAPDWLRNDAEPPPLVVEPARTPVLAGGGDVVVESDANADDREHDDDDLPPTQVPAPKNGVASRTESAEPPKMAMTSAMPQQPIKAEANGGSQPPTPGARQPGAVNSPEPEGGELADDERPAPVRQKRALANAQAVPTRRLVITFRRTGNLERDKYRLREIYDRVRDPRGRDDFCIRIVNSSGAAELAFPNDGCTISDRLMAELTKHFRLEVSVE